MRIEILSVGKWNGRDYTSEELDQLVRNFALLKERVKPPLKRGHDDEARLTKDGDPAIGWVTGLSRVGDKLLAEVELTSDVMRKAIEQKMYRRVSSEVGVNVKLGEEQIGLVLMGVALLGADLPAVDNLADLQAYLGTAEVVANALASAQRLTLTYQPEVTQVDPVKKVEITAEELEALKLSAAKNVTLEGEIIKLKEKQRLELYASQRLTLNTALEGLVKERKVLPAVREKLDGMCSGQEDKFTEQLLFTGKQVLELITGAAAPVPAAREGGEHHEAGELLDSSKGENQVDPAVEVARLAMKLVMDSPAGNKLVFGQAVQLVLQSNPELAQKHTASRQRLARQGLEELEKVGGRQ